MLLSLYAQLQTRFSKLYNERGASAVEYGLLVALIAVVIIGTLGFLGQNLDGIFQEIVDALSL